MNDYDLLKKLKEAVASIDQYQQKNNTKEIRGSWSTEVKTALKDLQQKSLVLSAAGRPCSRCGGSGVEP